VSDLIFPSIAPDLRVSIVGKEAKALGEFLGLAQRALEESDCAIFIVDANDGVRPEDQAIWATARELYIPSIVAITNIANSEIDFDDMSAIAGRLLDPVITPFLVLHAEDGSPTALIDLDSLKLIDYSDGERVERESDPEHKVLVFEFRKEYLDSIEEFGSDSFSSALTFPAIPVVPDLNLGKFEILDYLSKLPSRG